MSPSTNSKQRRLPVLIALNTTGWLIVALCWALVLVHYAQLPETIPTHFNGLGVADNYSEKSTIFFLPVILTVLYTLLTVLAQHPKTFNYPVAITPENKELQYRNARYLLASIQLSLAVIFTLITYYSMRAAILQLKEIPVWLLPLSLGLIFVPLFGFLLRSTKNK